MRRREFMLAMAAALAAPAASATSPGLLSEDIDLLEQAYTRLHPGLYRYASPHEMTQRFARLRHGFSRSVAASERYRVLSRFLAGIRCGHTYANFNNQTRALQTGLFAGKNRLPFHFRLLGERMVVTANQSGDPRLARGAEILAIDGVAPRRIVATMLPYMRADGHNDAKRRALLEVQGFDRFESFDVFYPLLFNAGDRFTLDVRPAGASRSVRCEVEALDLETRRAAMVEADAGADEPAWTLSEREGVAILRMPTWSLYNSAWDWRGFLDDAFASIASARGLIVDLRGNEGGLDCGNEILARLIDRDLPLAADERSVRFRSTPAALNPYLDTWDDSFRTLGEGAEDLGDGFYRLAGEPGVSSIAPKGPRFRAPVVVLIDAQNSSATFQFAQIMRDNGLGRLAGSPTGGNRRGINGGAFFFLRLPNSGIEVDVPLIGRFPMSPQPDAGLTPDVLVEPNFADIAADRDTALEAALRLF